MLDGSDLATHQTIRDIAVVIIELQARFKHTLDVVKQVERNGMQGQVQSIGLYLEKTTVEAKERVRGGEGRFIDIIQVELEH